MAGFSSGVRASLLATSLLGSSAAFAGQDASQAGADPVEQSQGDIVVTARKREETLISVPVAITAVSGEELARRGVNSIDALATMVPQLVVGEGGGTVQGGSIVLRGITGADANPFADQAVSFNVDGVQVARASVRRMASMDIQQVEVLKGPQALFYGKNSPGGIVSIRTADPTSTLQGKVSAGYEFNAHEWRGEGFVSGPITDTLGFRLAAYGSRMRGWVKNTVPEGLITTPEHDHQPRDKEYAVRGTLKFEPNDAFDARLKFTYNKLSGTSTTANYQLTDCALDAPQSGQVDNCRADDKISIGSLGPNFHNRDPRFPEDGETFLKQKQMLGSLELNYRLGDAITLTSVTGFYYVRLRNIGNFTSTYIPSALLTAYNRMNIRELSEELRVTSDFDGPLNFMIGAHLQDSKATNGSTSLFNAGLTLPTVINNFFLQQKGRAYSAFMQMQWDIVNSLQLSVGGRYSYEKKRLPFTRSGAAVNPDGTVMFPPPLTSPVVDKKSWNDFSPEVTLSYRPSRNLTAYASYKHGFISGGFNSGSANFSLPIDYDPQTVKGFEAGVKAALLDRALRVNFDVFTYAVKGLQVQVTTQGTIQELKNVGKLRSKGAEFDFSYRTPLPGLSLHGALAYNRARYVDYFATCYRGQSKARGCSFVPVPGQPGEAVPAAPGQNGSLQDLAGTEAGRAPEWTGNLGFNYEVPVGMGLKAGIGGHLTYSDSMFTDASSKPHGRAPSYTLVDGSLRIADEQERWEIALIGRNLTNEFYWVRGSDVPFTGTPPGNETGPAILADTESAVNRGREVMLRLTTKF